MATDGMARIVKFRAIFFRNSKGWNSPPLRIIIYPFQRFVYL